MGQISNIKLEFKQQDQYEEGKEKSKEKIYRMYRHQ